MIFDFRKFWEGFLIYIYTIKKYWMCWSLAAQGLAGGRRQKEKGKSILYYIILYYIYIYIYREVSTFASFVQKRGWFLRPLWKFWLLMLRRIFLSPPLSLTPQLFPRFANPQCLTNKTKHLTKFSMQHSCARLQTAKNSQKTLSILIT